MRRTAALTEGQNQLILNNSKLVYDVWNKYIVKEKDILTWQDDIIQEGFIGLCKAAKSYDVATGAKFSTFATTCIRNDMLYFIRNFLKLSCKPLSLDQAVDLDNNEDNITIEETIEDKTANPEKQLSQRELLSLLSDLIKIQPKHHIKILQCCLRGYKIRDIGQLFAGEFTTRQISVIKSKFLAITKTIIEENSYPSKISFPSQEEYFIELKNVWKETKQRVCYAR